MKKLLLIFILAFSITSCLIIKPQKSEAQDYIAWVNSPQDTGGYGMLYNWFCTQKQASVEYGYLYNWYTVADSRNICSAGWHIPSKAEFDALVSYLGGYLVAGGKLKETGTIHWANPNVSATNEMGFNARGSGKRLFDGTQFQSITSSLQLWTSTQVYATTAYALQLASGLSSTSIFDINKNFAVSIRPIKDFTTLTHGQTGTYVDPSGIIYPTICIGTQEWVACNIMTKHYRNGDAIPEVTDNTAWAALTTGARCSYNNTEANVGTTKKLSSSDSFIVPTSTIWNDLQTYLGGELIAGGKLKETGTTHWNSPNTGATNEVGFNAVGSGTRTSDTGDFEELKSFLRLWFFNATIDGFAGVVYLDSETENMLISDDEIGRGNSIRLCNPNTLNVEGSVNSYTQNDGTVIPTIVINGVEWTMNLKETKWSDGTDIQNITDNTAWSLLKEAACCDINNDTTKR